MFRPCDLHRWLAQNAVKSTSSATAPLHDAAVAQQKVCSAYTGRLAVDMDVETNTVDPEMHRDRRAGLRPSPL